jgi:apolipoprotein N-acyltransferase
VNLPKLKNLLKKNSLISLSLLSGILLSLSWPLNGVPVLIFISLIPLLKLEEFVLENRHKYGSYTVLLYSWLGFIVFNALTTWWIVFASVAGMLMAVFLNSFFMALPFAIMHVSRRILPGNLGSFSLVFLWITFEYLHMNWELSWSWLNLGNVFATMPRWIQWYEYTGVLGGTAWILIINICLFALLKTYRGSMKKIVVERVLHTNDDNEDQKKKTEIFIKNYHHFQNLKKRAVLGMVCLFLLIIPPIISYQIRKNFVMPDSPVEVVVIQPGRDPYLRPSGASQEREWINDMVGLARRHTTETTRFVVAPEVALPKSMWLHVMHKEYGYKALEDHASEFDSLTWITGTMIYRFYEDESELSATARPLSVSSGYYDVYNAALMVDSDGNADTYFKSKLVPGIERMPFARFLKPVGALVEMFGGTAGSIGVQERRTLFSGLDGTLVAPVICYESIYGEYVNEYIQKGAQLIFIITNDGWWRDTPGYKQHNQYARLRAIETRRSIARAAKTGISGFIDPLGEFIQQTSWWEADAIVAELHRNNTITYYVRNGDYLGRLSFFMTILLGVYIFTQLVMKRTKI